MSLPKLSKYIFFSFLFFFPFQTVLLLREPMIGGEKWQYGTIGLYGTDILLLAALVFHLSSRVQSRDLHMKWRIPRLADSLGMTEGILILFLLWVGASVFWATDMVLAGYFFAKLLLGVGVFFLVRSLDESDVKIAVKVLLAAAVIQGVIGIGQFVSQESVSSSLLGISAHESWQAGTSVLKLEEGRFLRAYGSFPHPNILGGFLAVVLVIGIERFIFFGAEKIKTVVMSRKELRRSGALLQERFFDTVRMIGITVVGAMLLLGLILTFSRAAWLGAAMGIVVYYVFCIQYFSHQTKSKCIIIPRPWNYDTFFKTMFVLGIATAVFVFVLRDQVFPRFDAATIVEEGSVSERMVSLQDAKTLITEHPLLGVGAGSFTAAIMENEPTRPVWSVQPAHNVFVLVWAELGAVGLVLFAVFLFGIPAKEGIQAVRNFWIPGQARDDRGGALVFLIALLVLLPSLFLDHWLWSSHFGILFLFLLAGLVPRKN